MVNQYLEHSKAILSSKDSKFKFNERRGLGRIFLFGYQNRYDLSEGFPLLTTKKLHTKSIIHELVWFLKGDTNIKYLVDNKVHIWDDDAFNYNLEKMVNEEIFPEKYKKFSPAWVEAKKQYVKRIKNDPEFAEKWGELGPVYGAQWRNWPSFELRGTTPEGQELYVKNPKGIDQISNLIAGMKKSGTSSRHLLSAWNPQEVPDMALPPCHTIFQLNSEGEQLDLHLYQRSCDMFLGVPFNIASYAMLTTIFANELDLKPGDFVHTFGDVHFYTGAGDRGRWYKDNFHELKKRMNEGGAKETLEWIEGNAPPEPAGTEGMDHVTGILKQLQRDPKPLPRLDIARKPFDQLTIDDFTLTGYDPHPHIKRTLAV